MDEESGVARCAVAVLGLTPLFTGPALRAVLGSGSSRRPGLAVRAKVPPLLAIRNEAPARRAAVPIPKSKRPKEEELDSDEELARANETPQQRMARMIRECDEEGGGH